MLMSKQLTLMPYTQSTGLLPRCTHFHQLSLRSKAYHSLHSHPNAHIHTHNSYNHAKHPIYDPP
jgi:hypothetical protein